MIINYHDQFILQLVEYSYNQGGYILYFRRQGDSFICARVIDIKSRNKYLP